MAEWTVRDSVEWLGLTWEQWLAMNEAGRDVHGGPHLNAVLATRTEAQRAATTPAEVLAAHGIDPNDPVAAVRDYDRFRDRYADRSESDD